MSGTIYTHALWRVKDGHERQFVEAWHELGKTFSSLDAPPLWGTLLRSTTDPLVFYSFGPWRELADAQAMRAHPRAQRAITAIRELCTESTPEICDMVAHVDTE